MSVTRIYIPAVLRSLCDWNVRGTFQSAVRDFDGAAVMGSGGKVRINNFARACLLALACCMSATAIGQEKTGNKEGFALKPGTVKIILMRPVIGVGEQSTGGLYEPNADWTTQARGHLGTALSEAQTQLGNQVMPYEESAGAEGPLVTQYSQLFNAVADSVIEYQFFPGNRLPTKKRDKGFEWAVGPGIAELKSLEGADYALFISTRHLFPVTRGGSITFPFRDKLRSVGTANSNICPSHTRARIYERLEDIRGVQASRRVPRRFR